MRQIFDLDGTPFINAPAAVMAMQAAQMYFSLAGFTTSSRIHLNCGEISLTIYFTLPNYPTLPNGYKYSTRKVESQVFWSETLNELYRVRTTTLTFKF